MIDISHSDWCFVMLDWAFVHDILIPHTRQVTLDISQVTLDTSGSPINFLDFHGEIYFVFEMTSKGVEYLLTLGTEWHFMTQPLFGWSIQKATSLW